MRDSAVPSVFLLNAAILFSGVVAVFLLAATGSVLASDASDQEITQSVKDKLATSVPQIARRIEVTTHDGVVTLTGTTLTTNYMLSVLQQARSVQGVTKVENPLAPE